MSSSTSAEKKLSDQCSPTSPFVEYNATDAPNISNPYGTKRSYSQTKVITAPLSPRSWQALSPSASSTIQPSYSANVVGGTAVNRPASRYMPRQTSLDNPSCYTGTDLSIFANNDGGSQTSDRFRQTMERNGNNFPPELSYATLRRPCIQNDKRYALGNLNFYLDGNDNSNSFSRQSVERHVNRYPLSRQPSDCSSTSTVGTLNEGECNIKSGVSYNMLRDNRTSGLPTKASSKLESSYSSICSTLGDNDENNKVQDEY